MNLRWLDRQLEFGPAREQRLQRADPFDPRELVAEAEMNSGDELRITKKRLAGEIEIHMLCHRAVPHCRFATRSRWCAASQVQGLCKLANLILPLKYLADG